MAGSREVKVGVFVTGLLLALAATIFMVGGSTDLLQDRYTLNGSWGDVSGLKEGAVVRLAGWDVGEVSAIRFSEDLGVQEIFVEMKVMSSYHERIRADSEARIDTVGVLGDKYIAISMGDPDTPVLEDGDWINTRPALDVLEYTKRVTDILNSTSSIGRKVDLMLGSDDEAAQAAVSSSFHHLEEILKEAKDGEGLVNALIYDKKLVRKVDRSLSNLEVSTANLRHITEEVKSGDGMAHELIYGHDGAQLAKDLAEVSRALSALTADIKNEESLVHSLVYDPEKAQMLDDLAVTAAAMKELSLHMADGDGTIGMLARDPALYEDLRALVGGAQRNKLLRAYIRQTVQKGEEVNAGPWEPAD